MEQFKVEPQFLKGYAEQVRRNANYIGQTHAYLTANGDKTDKMTGFLLSPIVDGYHKVLAWQLDLLDTMNRKLADSAAALDMAADAYSHTDQATATNLDKTYPAPPQSAPGSGGMRPE
ncbi:type VII secretion target [Kibdelosporangium lantanae]|uniref:Type VII secretion target n=1 Tax=Kibdelosporangium lantanae TaxID=1497396 RepID=A0ABW3M8P1_9PSEU